MANEAARPATSSDHIDWLDGLRGIAALWVLLSHVQILVGMPKIAVLSWGELAVDLFMLLSGFLMAFHYLARREREPWHRPLTACKFWLRRWFRIAPLYYVLLATALALGPWLGDHRDLIAEFWPWTATPSERYDDQSIQNALLHASFLFGVIPEYAFRTALPDWSIGLEMQFYVAFPFLMLGCAWFGAMRFGVLAILGCILLRKLAPEFMQGFEMPAFLPLKLYVFVVGIWLAVSLRNSRSSLPYLALSLLVAAYYARHLEAVAVGRLILVAFMFYLMDMESALPGARFVRGPLVALRRAFARPLARFLGETSYSVYLVHLLVLIPVAGSFAAVPGYVAAPAIVRYLLVMVATLAIVFPLAWVLYRAIERPGIALGKSTIAKLMARPGHAAVAPS
jgi:peptidoglycan/LPS O-acetylase OafA/YrhL